MPEEKIIYEHFAELEKKIGYTFRNRELLREALTHSSYANERGHGKLPYNERLEFLGDAVLELVSSQAIFEENSNMAEGAMTKLRASMVCEPSLAICARKLDLGSYLLVGKGEERTGGRKRDSILSDAFEAVIGAIFLDGGFDAAARHIRDNVLLTLKENQLFRDSKTALQEWSQKNFGTAPAYVLTAEEGPAHNRTFEVAVRIQDTELSRAKGPSKKAADQAAARLALEKIRENGTYVSEKH